MQNTTLSDGSLTLELTPDMLWTDEFDWKPVQQTMELSLTGAPIIDCAAVTGGRPITLMGTENGGGWIRRAQLDQLDAWGRIAGQQFALLLRGIQYNVIFRHQDGAISATPIVDYNNPESVDFYAVTLRLMEI